ncbi:MAG: TIGR02300 family protein [Candidatus Paracaedibacteraceae bacterium]|nr:TIGR02300 family protein [Candidatus Paracaedibacteraceae bacterium]
MVKLEWGTKRTCQSCASRFYDLQKSPIICPKCGSTYEIITTTRRGRKTVAKVAVVEEEILDDDIELDSSDDTLLDDEDDLDSDLDEVDVESDEDDN